MKNLKKNSLALSCTALFLLGFISASTAFAATSPPLGVASTYAILASTYTNTTAGTTINGDIGFTTGPAVVPSGTHTNYGSGAPYAMAGTDQNIALSALNAELCTFNFPAGAIDLSTETTHGPIGIYTPGVYCSTGAMNIGGPLTLNGNGTYIFRNDGALTSTVGAVVNLNGGASACDVFWTPGQATTLAANTTFVGTIIDNAGITIGANTKWSGMALAFGGTVITDTSTITAPVCTVAIPATLNIIKHVINNDGGTKNASDFTLTIGGVNAVGGNTIIGTESPGVSKTLSTVGAYTVTEIGLVGYTQSSSADCSGIIAAGETKTCTITNDDIATNATLHVIKEVVNNNGGTATPADFTMYVKSSNVDVLGSPAIGTATPGTSYTLSAGTYVVSEDVNIAYKQSYSGDCDSNGNITLIAGDNKTCTITNDDIAPIILPATINVVKIVINDNGRTKTIDDFPLFINGVPIVSGITNTFPTPATYTITETTDANYSRTFSGDCDSNGTINLVAGDNKFCIITNNDIAPSFGGGGGGGGHIIVPPVPPLIAVVKVPSPLALPNGPDFVTYTYTLRNIGKVPVSNIKMVGDTCSPIVLVSGDTNKDSILDVNEIWVHHCSTKLLKTHTNTVVTTGWANGLSATDIASATVIVGLPVVPPLIHVTKIPNLLTLHAGGGMVTYIMKITNPGTIPLSNVLLKDDKCSPVKYIFGDRNNDSKLDINETWTYTCRTNLTQTTTNTATASGEANGLTVRDFAIATVVVPTLVPALPNTGINFYLKNSGLDITISPKNLILKRLKTFIGKEITNVSGPITQNLDEGKLVKSTIQDVIYPEEIISLLPTRLKISKINVDTALESVGLTTQKAIDVPKVASNAAWFNLGPRPGENGSAVIIGHYGLWNNGDKSVFDNLSKLSKGDKLYIEDEKGGTISFVVRESRTYNNDSDASDIFISKDGKSHLNLITCEGEWDNVSKSYSKRLVVFTDKE